MSENIIYAKTVNEEPNDNIPVAEHPRVVVGEYVENIYDSQLSSNFVDNELVNTAKIEKCWIYSKSIRFISGFDILLCIFNGVFYSPWLFILTLPDLLPFHRFITLSAKMFILAPSLVCIVTNIISNGKTKLISLNL